jgi:predicted dehydrogenase
MPLPQRRDFLQSAAVGAAALATSPPIRAGESDKVIVGIIGPGGMGSNHLTNLLRRSDVEISYVCDVDKERLERAAKAVTDKSKREPKTVADMRKLLDDKNVDAVFIATPDHWHSPASILALDAGKHVYVEKPMSHNIREGRLVADAVKRSGKLLQVGTQSRSGAACIEAINRIKGGEIGEIMVAKAWNSQLRRNIGKVKPEDPPAGLDFDAWCGPAPLVPYRRNMLPGQFRWFRDFGAGDIGNDGVHDIDVAVWGLGVTTHPVRATCLGGKYFFDDDQEFPDTQYGVFEYAVEGKANVRKQLIYEQRIWSPYVQEGYENGVAFYGTKGLLIIGHSVGWKLYGERNKLIAEKSGGADLIAHHNNFFDCIRGNAKTLNADVMAGHLSATIVHLANIGARVNKVLEFDPKTEGITNDTEANGMVRRKYRDHWGTPKGV